VADNPVTIAIPIVLITVLCGLWLAAIGMKCRRLTAALNSDQAPVVPREGCASVAFLWERPYFAWAASNIATMFAGGTSAMMLWTCWKT
jgi:hypothetical protein